MHETLEEEERASKLRHEQLTQKLLRLDRQEENLLDLVADGEESSVKVRERLRGIQRQRNSLREQLDQVGERLELGASLIENALTLLEDPKSLYERMGDDQRRMMNKVIFERLYVDETIADATFNPPFDELLEALDTKQTAGQRRESLAALLQGQGSNKGVMVVLGWHYTNTPGSDKDQVTAILDGVPIGLELANAVLRVGNGDR